jgi:hypothetical protein
VPKPTQVQIAVGTEFGSDGNRIGRGPRRMMQDELRTIGHGPMSAHDAVRAHCFGCCGGSACEEGLLGDDYGSHA